MSIICDDIVHHVFGLDKACNASQNNCFDILYKYHNNYDYFLHFSFFHKVMYLYKHKMCESITTAQKRGIGHLSLVMYSSIICYTKVTIIYITQHRNAAKFRKSYQAFTCC